MLIAKSVSYYWRLPHWFFLRGLIKAPSPSDEIRQLVVIGLAVMGVILCTLGFLTVKQPDGR